MTERIAGAAGLDRVGEPVWRGVRRVLPRAVRAGLGGRWLGHPLHPAVVHLPVGAWVSAAVLDLSPRTRPAAAVLTAVGIVGAAPAMVTGLNDWLALPRDQRRVGVVHAGANLVALGLYAASLAAGRSGRLGRALAGAGLGVAGFSAFLGGHLAFSGRTLRTPHPALHPADHATIH
ncbi:DUF2231 domain-containing protein [Pilimelia anulata]|uniref:DUF2231 domain-containing protein n=1 Tax=Pilimelia anulata TaxID=53371 RepID=UPI001668E5BE|nr:DUF2231 domain-containing protein [Pilimelia anulata]